MPRRPVRKMRPRKARKGRRTAGKAANNTKTEIRVVYRQNFPIQVTAAVTPSLGNYTYSAYSPQNSQYITIAQQAEWQAQAKLYDEFNVTRVKYTYRPFANTQTLLQQVPTAPVTFFDTNVYTFVDRDGSNPVSTSSNAPQKIQSYSSCKVFSYMKKWSRTLSKKQFWTDTNNPTINPASSLGVAQPWINAGASQVFGIYAERLPLAVGALLGEMMIEYTVQFRGKKPALFAYDALSGSVIITPTTSYLPLAPDNPPSSVATTCGEEVLDISGTQIVVISTTDGKVAHAP